VATSFVKIPERIFQTTSLTLFAIWQFFFLSHHELWRDEIQAWNIAKASSSPLDLIHNLKYEGRPPLWHLILWVITKISDDPSSMKILAFLLSVASASILLALKNFTRFEKSLLLLGFYFAFGYSVVARDYNLILLLQLLAMRNSERGNGRKVKILSIILALVNPFGAVLGIFWLMQTFTKEHGYKTLRIKAVLNTSIYLLAIMATLVVFRMPSDSTFKADFSKSIPSAVLLAGHSVIAPFIPFHDNHTLNLKDLVLYGLVALLAVASLSRVKLDILVRYGLCLLLLAANATFGYAAYWWHFGAGILLYLAVIQESRFELSTSTHRKFNIPVVVSKYALHSIFTLAVLATFFGTGTDFQPNKTYSNIEAAGQVIQKECNECVIVTNSPVFGTPLWAYGAKVYVAPDGRFEKFVIWRKSTPLASEWEDLIRLSKELKARYIVVSHFDNPPQGVVELVKEFNGSIWGDDYQIYKVLG
jgi:hypothetical protein